MTQPITYYTNQSQAIDSLAEKYGSSFEVLTKQQKLFLQAFISESLSDGLFEVEDVYEPTIGLEFMEESLRLVRVSSERDLTGLLVSIAAQLHGGVYYQPPKPSDRDDSFPF